MKKIFLGLFILGTLGMAQQNYEVYVKNGVKISQSEADRDSKEIDKIINDKIISRYNNEGKQVIIGKAKELYNKYMDTLMDNIVQNSPKNQRQIFREFLSRFSEIISQNGFGTLDKMDISIKEISFLSKNKAKVIDDIDTDEIIEEALKKSGITDKELDHFEKVSKAKIDKFYEYLENKIKEEIKDSDYSENTTEMEIEKVDGKWQVNFDYDGFINEAIKNLENNFKDAENDTDD